MKPAEPPAGPAVRAWRLAAAVGFLAANSLAVIFATRPPDVVVRPEIVYVDRQLPTPEATVAAPESDAPATTDLVRWLRLRDEVLANGIAALPPAPPATRAAPVAIGWGGQLLD